MITLYMFVSAFLVYTFLLINGIVELMRSIAENDDRVDVIPKLLWPHWTFAFVSIPLYGLYLSLRRLGPSLSDKTGA